jgi:hypothetical protein
MRGQREGGLSATTQVKVSSPEIPIVARGQGVHFLEASNAVCDKGEHISSVPGSKPVAGIPTVHIGTWDSRIAPNRSFQQAEKARRKYGDAAVGLTQSRGVDRVMPVEFREPETLEGVSSRTQRDEEASVIH